MVSWQSKPVERDFIIFIQVKIEYKKKKLS